MELSTNLRADSIWPVENASTRAFSWLKATTTQVLLKNLFIKTLCKLGSWIRNRWCSTTSYWPAGGGSWAEVLVSAARMSPVWPSMLRRRLEISLLLTIPGVPVHAAALRPGPPPVRIAAAPAEVVTVHSRGQGHHQQGQSLMDQCYTYTSLAWP